MHHQPDWFRSEAPERLDAILERAHAADVDFIIQLGDLCHKPTESQELIARFEQSGIKAYNVIGNHEGDLNTLSEILACYHMPHEYYYFDCKGFRFIVLDTNYFSDFPGIYFHYGNRNYFDHSAARDWMPPEELEWFRKIVLESPWPCITFNHSSFEPGYGTVQNGHEIVEILHESQKYPGQVMLCLNGHLHRNNMTKIDNVVYFDVNSASGDWGSRPHYLYPSEWYRKYESVGNQMLYDDPLSAIVTVSEDGSIDIEGVKSSFTFGVSREKTGNAFAMRPSTPEILSACVKVMRNIPEQ
jgi:predicted phosphodiesterase